MDREALERKERLQAQAQRLESLGQLAGGVAHDFNNLLGVILNYVSFVSEEVAAATAVAGPDPAMHLEAASADLAEVKKAAERAAGLTHQLLVFARRDVIRPQVLDLNTVITSVRKCCAGPSASTSSSSPRSPVTCGRSWPIQASWSRCW